MKFLKFAVTFLCAVVVAQAADGDKKNDPLAITAEVLTALQEHHAAQTTPLTLEELEVAALANNPEIRAAVKQVAVVEARRGSAGSLEDPSFMYRGWGTPLSRPWDLNQTQHMFMYSQSFPGSGKRQLRSQIAETEVEVAKAEVEAKKNEILAQVRKTFYDLLQNQQGLRFHDEQVALAEQGLEAARIKYTVGKVPQSDLLKAQVSLTRLVEHLVMLQQDGDLARARLNTLRGQDPGAPLEVLGEYAPPSQLPGLLDLEKTALEHRPELTAISTSIREGEIRAQLAEKSLKPDYTVSGGYMVMPEESRYRNTYMAELSVTLPWLNRGRHNAEIAEANAAVAADKAEYESRRAAIFGEIQDLLVRARSAQRLVALYRDTLRPQAQAVLRATAAAYQTDRSDYLNLLDSQNSTLDVELNYIRALAEFEGRVADLERAAGAALPRTSELRNQPIQATESAPNQETRQ